MIAREPITQEDYLRNIERFAAVGGKLDSKILEEIQVFYTLASKSKKLADLMNSHGKSILHYAAQYLKLEPSWIDVFSEQLYIKDKFGRNPIFYLAFNESIPLIDVYSMIHKIDDLEILRAKDFTDVELTDFARENSRPMLAKIIDYRVMDLTSFSHVSRVIGVVNSAMVSDLPLTPLSSSEIFSASMAADVELERGTTNSLLSKSQFVYKTPEHPSR